MTIKKSGSQFFRDNN